MIQRQPGRATRRRTVAVVLAGGTGTRVGADRPKQLLQVGGRSLLELAVHAFADAPGVDEVLVMMAPDHVAEAQALLADVPAVSGVHPGGATRQESTALALARLDGDLDVLVHDAARPFVSAALVARCLDALTAHEAVVPVVAATDTVYAVEDGRVVEVLQRDALRCAQTPQCFRLAVLRRAHDAAAADPSGPATDDVGIVRRHAPDVDVHLVEGDPANLKVTNPTDVAVAEVLAARTTR